MHITHSQLCQTKFLETPVKGSGVCTNYGIPFTTLFGHFIQHFSLLIEPTYPLIKTRIRIRLFSLNPDPNRPKFRIQIHKKTFKDCKDKQKQFFFFLSNTLHTLSTHSCVVRFLQTLIKKHHLDPITLLTDGSGFFYVRFQIRIGERIRNTALMYFTPYVRFRTP